MSSSADRSAPGPRPPAWTGLALLCVAGVVWGTIGPVVGLLHERSALSVLVVGGYRSLAAVTTLAVVVTLARSWAQTRALVRSDARRVLVTGALTATFQLLYFLAVVDVGVSVATVVTLGFAPVLLLALGSLRARRAPARAEVLTVAAALAGLVLVSLGGAGPADGARHPLVGVLLALASGAAYALGAEVGSGLSHRHDALAVTTGTTAVVALVLAPVGLVSGLVSGGPLVTGDATAWALIAYLGAVTLALAYVLLYAGLRSTPSGTAVVATLLEPVTAVALAVAFLGERLTLRAVLGCVLIVLAIATLGRRLEPPPPT